jgi:hypothetical protein
MRTGEKFKNMVEKAISVGIVPNKATFAKLLGVNEASMYRWFTMDSIKTKHLKKACEIMKISLEDFFREDNPAQLVQDPQAVYVTKSQRLALDLDACHRLNERLQVEIDGLKKQVALQEEIITVLKAK